MSDKTIPRIVKIGPVSDEEIDIAGECEGTEEIILDGTVLYENFFTKGNIKAIGGSFKNIKTEGNLFSHDSHHAHVTANDIKLIQCQAEDLHAKETIYVGYSDVDNLTAKTHIRVVDCDRVESIKCQGDVVAVNCREGGVCETHSLQATSIGFKSVKCHVGSFLSSTIKSLHTDICEGLGGCKIKQMVTSEPILFVHETCIEELIIEYQEPKLDPKSKPSRKRGRGRGKAKEEKESSSPGIVPVVIVSNSCDIKRIEFKGVKGNVQIINIKDEEDCNSTVGKVINGAIETIVKESHVQRKYK